MAISLNSFSPNTQAKSTEVNQNFTNLKTGVEQAAFRAIPWGILGTLTTGDEQGMKFIVPQNITAKTLWVKTGSGTCSIRIQADSDNIKASQSVSSTVASTSSFDLTEITAGEVLTLDILSVSSAVDLFVTLECQVTTIA